MKTFEIEILELRSRIKAVEAENQDDAILISREAYESGAEETDANDIAEVHFSDINDLHPHAQAGDCIAEIENKLGQLPKALAADISASLEKLRGLIQKAVF